MPLSTNTKSGLRLGSFLERSVETTRSPKECLVASEYSVTALFGLSIDPGNSIVDMLFTLVHYHGVGSQRKNHGVTSKINLMESH